MEVRNKRWETRKEKEPQLRLCRLGGAVELITNEKVEGEEALTTKSIRLIRELDFNTRGCPKQ